MVEYCCRYARIVRILVTTRLSKARDAVYQCQECRGAEYQCRVISSGTEQYTEWQCGVCNYVNRTDTSMLTVGTRCANECGAVVYRLIVDGTTYGAMYCEYVDTDDEDIWTEEVSVIEVPTTACMNANCDAIVPVSEVYISKEDDRAVCEKCFKKAEASGRAKLVAE